LRTRASSPHSIGTVPPTSQIGVPARGLGEEILDPPGAVALAHFQLVGVAPAEHAEEFGQCGDLCAALGSARDEAPRGREIELDIRRRNHLDRRDARCGHGAPLGERGCAFSCSIFGSPHGPLTEYS
jgi:hypothetical protein